LSDQAIRAQIREKAHSDGYARGAWHSFTQAPRLCHSLGLRRPWGSAQFVALQWTPLFLPFPLLNMPDESTLNAVRAALEAYVDPYTGQSLAEAQAVREVKPGANGGFTARIALGFPVGGYEEELREALTDHLGAAGIKAPLTLELQSDIKAHSVHRNLKPLEQ